MIKNGIKNFFVNLKHFFTPLGVFALFVIIGLSVAIPACISAVSTLADDAARICNDTSIDLNALGDGVMRSVRALDWSNPTDAVQTILSEGWLKNTFVTCVDALVVSGGETAASQIAVAAETAVSGVAAGFVALVVFAVLGIAAGYMLTKFSVRRNMAKRGLWKFILAAAVDAVLTVLLIIHRVDRSHKLGKRRYSGRALHARARTDCAFGSISRARAQKSAHAAGGEHRQRA